jgi:hypothetical protein
MRLETTDASWRIRLGPRARQLVQSVMGEEEKPDGDLLERALSQLDQDLAEARGQIKVLEDIAARIVPDLAEVKATVLETSGHTSMMLGMVYRQIFVCRQVMGLMQPHGGAVGTIVEKTLEVLQLADDTYRRLIPEPERRFQDFDLKLETEVLERCRVAFKGEMTSSTKSMGLLCHQI